MKIAQIQFTPWDKVYNFNAENLKVKRGDYVVVETELGEELGKVLLISDRELKADEIAGGERALTAIALICAIISANPSPFVVLDEVDAALDEANSERLAQILDDLSNQTQFIVITHNRASMKRANILYGVTMQSDGVSKLLSVKLDEVSSRQDHA